MKQGRAGIVGWIFADLLLVFAIIALAVGPSVATDSDEGSSPTTTSTPNPDPPPLDPLLATCIPGLEPRPAIIEINLSGVAIPLGSPLGSVLEGEFAQLVTDTVEDFLDSEGLAGAEAGLVQTFTNLNGSPGQEVGSSLLINRILRSRLDELWHLGTVGLDDEEEADLRIRSFQGGGSNSRARIEWFVLNECR